MNNEELARYIDHTALKANTSPAQIRKLLAEARQYQFVAVCVNSYWVGLAANTLQGTGVKVCSVIGFPLGAMHSKAKAFEAKQAIKDGADEIDMVINVGAMTQVKRVADFGFGAAKMVSDDIIRVVKACKKVPVKVIIETAMLNDEQKRLACTLAKNAGAAYVKTCTGFGGGQATDEDIRLMRKTVGPDMGIKASGGIKTRKDALALIEAGATRLGTSSGIQIING